eukprot:g7324.t1
MVCSKAAAHLPGLRWLHDVTAARGADRRDASCASYASAVQEVHNQKALGPAGVLLSRGEVVEGAAASLKTWMSVILNL